MRKIFVALWLLCGVWGALAQNTDKEDSLICVRTMQHLKKSHPKDGGEAMVQTALQFLDRPYVAATLEKDPEQLVVNLREFDCTTLVESVLALNTSATTFAGFKEALQRIRYRNAKVQYTERLHYIADWIYENSKNELVKDVTSSLPGSQKLNLLLSFMSTHPDSYPALKGNQERISRMSEIESEINARNIYTYLPKESLKKALPQIKNGDILGFVTTIKGLDVTHMGIAYWDTPERLTFIHASSLAKKVIVNQSSLEAYLTAQKRCKGLWVIRFGYKN